jgi:hypothetical protein
MMSFYLSGGVEVLGFISPTEPTDEYPVIDPLYGIDGFRNVNTLSDLNSIPNLRRRAGMVVGVSGGTQYYKLNPEPWNGTITDWTIFNSGGGAFTGGTVTGDTIFTQGITATTFSASTYLGLPLDVYVTGGTYSNGILTFTNNSGNTFNISGLYTGGTDFYVTGGTFDKNTETLTLERNDGNNIQITGFTDIYTTGFTFNPSNYNISVELNDGTTLTQNLSILATDVTITGGTYNPLNGSVTFVNNTGGTFTVSGFITGFTDVQVTGYTYQDNTFTISDSSGNTFSTTIDTVTGLTVNGDLNVTGNTILNSLSATTYQNLPLDVYVTGGTYSNGTIVFTNNSGDTFNVTGLYTGQTSYVNSLTTGFGLSADTTTGDITIINTDPDQIVTLSGGTGILTGGTYPNFTIENSLPDQTVVLNNGSNISVTGTYPNFTVDVTGLTDNDKYVTGFTYQDNTFTISDNSGSTFTATINTVTGLTVNGILSATTISGGTLYGDGSNLTGLSSGLNVGVTQITSGTDGRVLFQSGTTLQQSSTFIYSGQTLILKPTGSTSSDIPFVIQNSGGTITNFYVNGLGEGYFNSQQPQPYGITIENTQTSSLSENTLGSRLTLVSAGTNPGDRAYLHYHNSNGGGSSAGTFIISSPRGFRFDSPSTYLSDNYRWTTSSSGNHLALQAVGSGNILRLNIAAGGSTTSEIQIANVTSNYAWWKAPNSDANHAMSWGRTATEYMRLNQSGFLGIGTTSPQARLDVRAQGALSTDIVFRVRNSGDTANLFNVNGDGTFSFPNRIVGDTAGLGARLVFGNAAVMHTQANHVNITGSRIEVDSAQTMLSTNSGQNVRFTSSSVVNSQIVLNFSSGQIHLGGAISDVFNGNNIFSAVNGTAPTSSLIDRFLLYSADRGGTAGRASLHVRSEDGTINVLGDRTGINTSTPQARLHVANGDTTLTTGLFSGTGQNILTVVGSGNTTSSPIFTVQGSSGELFSVSDSLVGSLFSVNDISGLPILEVFSDNTTLMGSYLAPSLNTTSRVIATTGTTNVYSIPTSAYTGAFFDYTVSDGTNLRAGNIMSIWSGSSVNITETQTTDFGNTSGLTFNMVVTSGNAILRTSGTTGNWTVKTIVRSI